MASLLNPDPTSVWWGIEHIILVLAGGVIGSLLGCLILWLVVGRR